MLNVESNNRGQSKPERDEGDPLLEQIIMNWKKLDRNTREWVFFMVWRRSVRRRNTPPIYHRYTTFSDGNIIHTEEE